VPGRCCQGYFWVYGRPGGDVLFDWRISEAGTGRFLWRYDRAASNNANVPDAIFFQDRVFAASGYGNGGGQVRLAVKDQQVTATIKTLSGAVLVSGQATKLARSCAPETRFRPRPGPAWF
jgi:hypothetical protein